MGEEKTFNRLSFVVFIRVYLGKFDNYINFSTTVKKSDSFLIVFCVTSGFSRTCARSNLSGARSNFNHQSLECLDTIDTYTGNI